MGEQWLLLWVLSFVGLLVIAVTIYDYLDRRKRNAKVKLWKYALAMIVGLALMYPFFSGLVMTFPKFFGGAESYFKKGKGAFRCIRISNEHHSPDLRCPV